MKPDEVFEATAACIDLEQSLVGLLEQRRPRKDPGWATLRHPCLDRGSHAIYPLLAAPVTQAGDSPAERGFGAVSEQLSNHWGYQYGGHDRRVGTFADNDEWGRKELGEKLGSRDEARGGRVFWWEVAHHVVVFVGSTDARRDQLTAALHAVPGEWVLAGRFTPPHDRDLSRCRSVVRAVQAAVFDWVPPRPADDADRLWVTGPDRPTS